MLKDLLKTLKNIKHGIYAEDIDSEFGYLIPDTRVYTMYSLKFEVKKDEFKEYLRDIIDGMEIFEFDDEFLEKTLEVSDKWYAYWIENKRLNSYTSSLKSELKKLYKKRTGDIKGFDRFFETILNAINEASNVFDVVFYNPEALVKNKSFASDRNSCYINGRPDYLKALKQTNVYYVMIYKNQIPLTRVWFVTDQDYENAAIFNQYGHKFKNLNKFFDTNGNLATGNYVKLEKALGVYVNDSIVWTTTDKYDTFIYRLSCPTCHNMISSNQLILTYDEEEKIYKLQCFYCRDDLVYSEISQAYIPEEESIYSEYHDDYLHRNDAVYSYYLNDYIHDSIATWVWNADINDYDYVPREMAVYSSHHVKRLIKDQAVYSYFYGSYMLKDEAVYCEEVDSYVSKTDTRFTEVDGKCVTAMPILIPVHS